jgi:hypothetical protein
MANKPSSFQLSLPVSQAGSVRFPDFCCCCSGPVRPEDKKDFKHATGVFSIPTCPACRKHWRKTYWSNQILSFGLFMLLALVVAAGNSPATIMHFGFIIASLLTASFLVLGLGLRPRKEAGHVKPGKEPAKEYKLGDKFQFQFVNPRFALRFGELNGQDRKVLLARWQLDPETLAPKK